MLKRKVRIHGLSDYLAGKSVNTLYKLVAGNRIPYERVGRDLYFDLDKIDAWMAVGGNDGADRMPDPKAPQGRREDEASEIADRILAEA